MAPLGSNQYGLRRLTHLTTSILSKTHLTTWYFLAINYLSCKRRMECEHYYNYFLIRFTQTKITLFVFFSNWVSKGKRKCSRVPKSRAIFGGSITLLNFLRLTIMILNYLWYTHNLPWKSLSDTPLYAPHLIRSCVTRNFSNQDSLLLEL